MRLVSTVRAIAGVASIAAADAEVQPVSRRMYADELHQAAAAGTLDGAMFWLGHAAFNGAPVEDRALVLAAWYRVHGDHQ